MAPKIAQKSVSAPKGRPEASREPLGTHFGAILASSWPPRGIIFKLFQACTSKLSKKPFEKAVRNHWSKGLSGHLHARAAEGLARWPVWARMRLLDIRKTWFYGEFDFVWSSEVIEHIIDDNFFFQNLVKSTKKTILLYSPVL